jgi:hypothetical protein
MHTKGTAMTAMRALSLDKEFLEFEREKLEMLVVVRSCLDFLLATRLDKNVRVAVEFTRASLVTAIEVQSVMPEIHLGFNVEGTQIQ